MRIARELHDVVAHHVSVMGVQASATRRVMDKDPDKARTALAAVEQSARTAVDELRRMLSLLRASDAPTDERPGGAGIDRVDDLVGNAREAGLRASLGVYGEPVPLPDSLSQAAYRVVQEALTNTIKHAGATAIDVRIRYHAGELEVDVTDDGGRRPRHGGRRAGPHRHARAGRRARRHAGGGLPAGRRLPGARPLPARRAGAGVIRVLLADDQHLVRTGFRVILEAEDDIDGGRRGVRRRGRPSTWRPACAPTSC